ncbi:choline dehydrogenase-like flavoprotein [Salinibacter ruber]|uniref:GMC oxidoreductase n=1 Tax=Salinibacter ruber TaxID=146919 RepID=UPI0021695364|nr:GMC oxidoreductase [Salinibacter ruber]MCS3700179.1 choline dehydrogenase-like flavoprotein [Salinibacter ruber]
MPIIDARSLNGGESDQDCDVCIVGAGAAGIYLGVRLARKGLDVVILEAGGQVCDDGDAVGFEAELQGMAYRGADEGRAFGLGGTTSRWGGVLVPHTEHDHRPCQNGQFEPWRHIVRVVAEHSDTVLDTLDLRPRLDGDALAHRDLGEEAEAVVNSGLDLQIAQYLPFRRKNLATLLDDVPDGHENLTVLLNAVATGWQLSTTPDGTSRVSRVEASCGSQRVTVSAQSFVVAAGALESARILLEMERQADAAPFPEEAAIGDYLGDHLSCPIARVPSEERTRAASLFRPRFAGGRMYYFRVLEDSVPDDAPRSFAHFIFENESPGFELAKEVLQGLQARTFPDVSPAEVMKGLKGVAALGWNRWVHSRLHIPADTPARLQLDVEQRPSAQNRIRLGDRKDEYGRPVPVIEWEIKDDDYDAIRQTARRFLERWPGPEHGLPELRPASEDIAERKPYDAYHPVGVCHLGKSAEAVVDPELQAYGTENLRVLSTAVFPTAGTANPTFSMLCFAEMLAGQLQKTVDAPDARRESIP